MLRNEFVNLKIYAALTLDEPELEAIVIGNVNTSATTSESEVRNEAIDLEDDDICVKLSC